MIGIYPLIQSLFYLPEEKNSAVIDKIAYIIMCAVILDFSLEGDIINLKQPVAKKKNGRVQWRH